ncbi:ATP-binding cassette sub-family A member 2-like [Saccoglossus kowalevskii]
MGQFILQLRLVLWKNYTQKKRSPVSLAIEFLFPLIAFIIFVGLHRKYPAKYIPEAHYTARPLPSAGIIPLLQVFCPSATRDPYGFPVYSQSRVPEFLSVLDTVVHKYSSQNMTEYELENLFITTTQLLSDVNMNSVKRIHNDIEKNGRSPDIFLENMGTFINILSSSEKITNNLQQLIEITQQLQPLITYIDSLDLAVEIDSNLTSEIMTNGLGFFYQRMSLKAETQHPKELMQLLEIWLRLRPILCGVNSTINMDALREGDWVGSRIGSRSLEYMAKMADMYILGNPKIVFAPNTTDVYDVINKTQTYLQSHPELLEVFMSSLTDHMKTLILNTTLPNINIIEHQLSILHDVLTLWNSSVPSNISIFQPFPDESAALNYALNTSLHQNSVFAVLLFKVDENGSLPNSTMYTIRQVDGTVTDNAHGNRIWGLSKRLFPISYYEGGFMWLQDMIDHAIMEKRVGHSVTEPGNYVQEFPYIEYLYDKFFLTTFFSKSKLAAAFCGIIYFLGMMPMMAVNNFESQNYDVIGVREKFLACLFPSSAIGCGLSYIGTLDDQMVGLQWSNMNIPLTDHDLSVTQVTLTMLLSCVIFLLLIWYIELVYPGDYGIALPWYFPITKSYWCNHGNESKNGCCINTRNTGYTSLMEEDQQNVLSNMERSSRCKYEEECTSNMDVGVKIKNLEKVKEKT